MANDTNFISTQIVTVTPSLAREWLGKNIDNRTIKKSLVARYRRDMALDRWKFAGDPIRFGASGRLLDGQHRLLAISQMPDDFTIKMMVLLGIDDESQKLMDQGGTRSGYDQLQRAGVKYASRVSAAARTMVLIDEGVFFKSTSIWQEYGSVAAVEEWVAEHPYEVKVIQDVSTITTRIEAAPSALNTAAVIISRVAPAETVIEFFGFIADGGAAKNSGPNVLANKLRRAKRVGVNWSPRDVIANTIRAWNSWVTGKTTTLNDPHHTHGGKSGWTEESFPTPIYR